MKREIQKILPAWVKPVLRFFYYRNERKKVLREIRIRKIQNDTLTQSYSANTKRLIVFCVEGGDWETGKDKISGGILSIASIFEETLKLKHIHQAEVIMCTYPGAHLLLQHEEFPNNIQVYRFNQLEKHFKSLEFLLIHSICYQTPEFAKRSLQNNPWVKIIKDFRINVLNQNIKLMPPPESFIPVKTLTEKISQTTAHKSYSTKAVRDAYGFPLHYLSVFGSPERYVKRNYEEKKDLILLSPDQAYFKAGLVENLKSNFSDFSVEVIQNLKYKDYLKKIGEAKFMITLGEGLDFYFLEQVFSGGVSFAIFNQEFFPLDFGELTGVFPDEEALLKNVSTLIKELDSGQNYCDANKAQHKLCSKYYKYEEYRQNLEKFYLGDYSYA